MTVCSSTVSPRTSWHGRELTNPGNWHFLRGQLLSRTRLTARRVRARRRPAASPASQADARLAFGRPARADFPARAFHFERGSCGGFLSSARPSLPSRAEAGFQRDAKGGGPSGDKTPVSGFPPRRRWALPLPQRLRRASRLHASATFTCGAAWTDSPACTHRPRRRRRAAARAQRGRRVPIWPTRLGERWAEPAFAYYRAFDRMFEAAASSERERAHCAAFEGDLLRRLCVHDVLMIGGEVFVSKHLLTSCDDVSIDVVERDPRHRAHRTRFLLRGSSRASSDPMKAGVVSSMMVDDGLSIFSASAFYDVIIDDAFGRGRRRRLALG